MEMQQSKNLLMNRLDQGIKIECGDKYLTLYGQHYGVVAISYDRGWNNAWTHNNVEKVMTLL